jgi:transcriptional regulator with XRE-family HTH domain
MKNQIDPVELDDVLDAFLATGAPSATALREFIQRYPQFQQELTEFAASWQLSEALPMSPDVQRVSDEMIVERGIRAVNELLSGRQFQVEPAGVPVGSVAQPPVRSLLDEARAQGLRPRQFAAAAGMGESLLAKLDRGLVRFASIPREAMESLAEALHRDLASIQSYLEARTPSVAPMAAFKAEQAPEVGQPEDFASAVETDATMNAEQRQRWLDLARPDRQ